MKKLFRNLGPSVFLIMLLSALLLISETPKKQNLSETGLHRIAIFKYSSRTTLDDTERGYIDGLATEGYINGKTIELIRYNAENDLPTAHLIAAEILNKNVDLVITASTPALQVMAKANQKGKIRHVFGTVTDPFGSGVGLNKDKPEDRPAWLAGAGTFQPVEKAFLYALEMNPGLKKVGVVWCTGETCSEACVRIARRVCKEHGIKLIENTVDNSTSVYEAAKALVSKGVEALWIGGDNTVEIAAAMVIKAGAEGDIPVFTNNTDHPPLGALFGLGANYYEVGLSVGKLASEILRGRTPASIPIENVVPEKLVFNAEKLMYFNNKNWRITANLKQKSEQ